RGSGVLPPMRRAASAPRRPDHPARQGLAPPVGLVPRRLDLAGAARARDRGSGGSGLRRLARGPLGRQQQDGRPDLVRLQRPVTQSVPEPPTTTAPTTAAQPPPPPPPPPPNRPLSWPAARSGWTIVL